MRRITSLLALVSIVFTLTACGAASQDAAVPTQSQGDSTVTTPPTQPTQPSYPRLGNAPDYSWIAGRVTFTRIQGGCIYVITDQAAIDAAIATPNPNSGISGPIVSTAVKNDTSPPLRDMTPQTGPMPTQPPGVRFLASGPGWDPNATKDGDYVLLFGRLAGPGDAQEMCPGGTGYVVDKMQLNP
jgi:hypothetical protein